MKSTTQRGIDGLPKGCKSSDSRVQNATDISTHELTKVIEFLQVLVPMAALARFEFHPRVQQAQKIVGDTTKTKGKLFPALVRLWLTNPADHRYPRQEHYVKRLDPILIHSWQEELVLVLAHEMRHVEQFYTELGLRLEAVGKWECEVDAEQFAYRALDIWRKDKRSGKIKLGAA